MALSASDMVQKLQGVQPGQTVFVSYLAGREPTDRQVREAQKARREGYPRRWYFGRLERQWTTQKGEPVFCIFTHTRDNETDPNADGNYRTFNPSLGTLLELEVIAA
jgi:hypothetical protein